MRFFRNMIGLIIGIVNIGLSHSAFAESYLFANNTSYQVCFTPGQNCTELIVNLIDSAKKSVYVQAYSFTSAPIAKSLVNAKNRGVQIQAILDKSNLKNNHFSSATFLMNHNIATWIDYQPAIAHNKVMIIDSKTVITGSFNFTKAAQYKNAENLLIINNGNLAMLYLKNWLKRQAQSVPADQYN